MYLELMNHHEQFKTFKHRTFQKSNAKPRKCYKVSSKSCILKQNCTPTFLIENVKSRHRQYGHLSV